MAAPARLAGLLGAAVILALMGPFNTGDVMRFVPRLAYWAAIVLLCYCVGYFGNIAGDRLAGAKAGILRRAAFCIPLTAIGVLAVVYGLTGLAIGFWATGTSLALLTLNVAVISAIITVVFLMVDHSTPDQPPALLDRITFAKRAPLVALSVEDHYVRITTTKGDDLVLMRLSDAIKETGQIAGFQVHRSHWIALDQVTDATRKGDGALLSMSHGPDIPVSRANIPKIKEAGLLPR